MTMPCHGALLVAGCSTTSIARTVPAPTSEADIVVTGCGFVDRAVDIVEIDRTRTEANAFDRLASAPRGATSTRVSRRAGLR